MSLDIRQFVIDWNSRFPIDYWWRSKYKVAFNSPTHRQGNFLDMLFEFEEEKAYQQLQSTTTKTVTYSPGRGEWLTVCEQKLSQQQTDDVFDKIDLHTFNTQSDKKTIIAR